MKRCPKCTETKPATLEFFYAGKKWRDGFRPYCKVCQIRLAGEWRKSNPEKARASRNAGAKRAVHKNVLRTRKWEKANPEKVRLARRRCDARRAALPRYVLSRRLRAALRRSMGTSKGGRSWEAVLGYSRADLIAHFERQFQPGMGWHNMGEWHIDHVRPVSSFAFETVEDEGFKECWALDNLAPMWVKDNMRKGSKWAAGTEPVW